MADPLAIEHHSQRQASGLDGDLGLKATDLVILTSLRRAHERKRRLVDTLDILTGRRIVDAM